VNSFQQSPPREGSIAPSLLDYLQVLRRHKLLFLLIVYLVPATAVTLSIRQAPEYQASAQVLLTPLSAQAQPGSTAQTQVQLAKVADILSAVTGEVPDADLTQTELRKASTVSSAPGSDILTFSVKSSSPELAMRLATAYAEAFTTYKRLNHRPPPADVVERADQAAKVGPQTVRNAALALFLGVVLALVVVFLVDAADTRLRSADTIREALGLRLLGQLPVPPAHLAKQSSLVMLAEPTSHEAEPFRVLRVSLDFANAEQGSRSIMFTSAGDAEGKTTTAANLAVALARAGRRIILIDADLRRPNLHNVFGLDARPGLADVALGDVELEHALRPIPLIEATSAVDGGRRMHTNGSLDVLSAGFALPDPDQLGAERAIGRIVKRAQERADLVLIDAPPLLVGDAIGLSAHVDAVVLVARLRALRRSMLADVSRIFEASPAVKLGFILTGAGKSDGYTRYTPHTAPESRSASVLPLTPPAASRNGSDAASRNGSDADAHPVRRESGARDT
jgi:polysaccharide biosynthesis transport protein